MVLLKGLAMIPGMWTEKVTKFQVINGNTYTTISIFIMESYRDELLLGGGSCWFHFHFSLLSLSAIVCTR